MVRLVNLLRRTVAEYRDGAATVREPDAEELELIEERRGPLMESIIEESEDEVLLERHLNGEDIEFETVATDLRAAIGTARFFPIVATHAPSGMGIEELYDLFEHGFPVAGRRDHAGGPDRGRSGLRGDHVRSGRPAGRRGGADHERPVRRPALKVRVFSGTLSADVPLHVSGHLSRFASHHVSAHADHDIDDERTGPLAAPVADETRPKTHAIAGDLVLVSKLTAAETSDTLSGKARPALVEPWLLPEPLLPIAVHAATRNEEEKLVSALQRLVAEDVTMRLEQNAETHQMVLWTMGPAHVDKLLTALRDGWRVGVDVEPVRTSFARPSSARPRCRAGW